MKRYLSLGLLIACSTGAPVEEDCWWCVDTGVHTDSGAPDTDGSGKDTGFSKDTGKDPGGGKDTGDSTGSGYWSGDLATASGLGTIVFTSESCVLTYAIEEAETITCPTCALAFTIVYGPATAELDEDCAAAAGLTGKALSIGHEDAGTLAMEYAGTWYSFGKSGIEGDRWLFGYEGK